MFKQQPPAGPEMVTITFEGERVTVPAGISVAAAVLSLGVEYTRASTVSGAARAPYCLMGTCFECLMEIDGVPNVQACMLTIQEGMRIKRQQGERDIGDL